MIILFSPVRTVNLMIQNKEDLYKVSIPESGSAKVSKLTLLELPVSKFLETKLLIRTGRLVNGTFHIFRNNCVILKEYVK